MKCVRKADTQRPETNFLTWAKWVMPFTEIKKMGEMIFRGKEFKSLLREINFEMLIRHLGVESVDSWLYKSQDQTEGWDIQVGVIS